MLTHGSKNRSSSFFMEQLRSYQLFKQGPLPRRWLLIILSLLLLLLRYFNNNLNTGVFVPITHLFFSLPSISEGNILSAI